VGKNGGSWRGKREGEGRFVDGRLRGGAGRMETIECQTIDGRDGTRRIDSHDQIH
jgi:hypothetical protein